MRNTGNRWDLAFKSGACLEFLFGADESADPARQAPVAGDKRLLVTLQEGRPLAVLYDMVVPGTPADKKWRVASPVGQTEIDVVRRLSGVKLLMKPIWRDINKREQSARLRGRSRRCRWRSWASCSATACG